jgi:hypothetical protein
MKKLVLIALLLAVAVLSGCGEDEPMPTDARLVGSWKLLTIRGANEKILEKIPIDTNDVFFTSDGYIKYSANDFVIKYSTSDNVITVYHCDEKGQVLGNIDNGYIQKYSYTFFDANDSLLAKHKEGIIELSMNTPTTYELRRVIR